MVHEDDADLISLTASLTSTSFEASPKEDIWRQSVLKITQWVMILQEIFEEREINNTNPLNNECLCLKASSIGQKIGRLEYVMSAILDDSNEDTSEDDLILIVDEVQSALRAGVSIQISKPNEAVMDRASSILEAALLSCDKVAYVKSVTESIIKLVNDLLNVPTCGHASNANLLDDTDRIRDVSPTRLMEQDEEEDIRVRVESMFNDDTDEDGDDEDEEEEEEMDIGSGNGSRTARKRKVKKGSPNSSPSKRPRKLKSPLPSTSASGSWCSASAPAKICQTSPALEMLETKKKVQRNSLYHWVLWREALRGEKDRVQSNPRRLSFN